MASESTGLYDLALPEPLPDYVNSNPQDLSSFRSTISREIALFEQRIPDGTRPYKVISLQQFSSEYAHQLPQQIKVTKGVYGDDENSTISCEDEYSVHFVVHRELVRVEDPKNAEVFSIPVNSSIKFGFLYNPNNSEREALRGFVFPKVADILNMGIHKLPRLVCTMLSCESPNTKTSLQEGEVLLLRGAFSTDSGRKLRVYSFIEHAEKCIDESTAGHFATKPYHVRLFLTDILKYIPSPIPAALVSFPSQQTTTGSKLPSNRVFQMTLRFTDVLLIVTNTSGDLNVEETEPFEVPTDLDVEIVIIDVPEKTRLQLQVDTEYLKEQLGYRSARPYRYVNVTDSAYQRQSEFYKAVRFNEYIGYDPDQEGDEEEGRVGEAGYQSASRGNKLGVRKRLEILEKVTKRIEANVATIEPELASLATTTHAILEERKERDAQMSTQDQRLQTALLQVKQLQDEMSQLRDMPSTSVKEVLPVSLSSGLPTVSSTLSLEEQERNRALLASLDQKQVSQ